MSTEHLARLQFAFTISFHYLYPPLSIGLGLLLVTIEGLWLKTKHPLYHQMARFWTKVFALTFAIGVATGRNETTRGLAVPGLLSWLATGDSAQPVTGLRDIPRDERPPVNLTFQFFHLMVAVGFALIGLAVWAAWALGRSTLENSRPLLWLLVFSVLGPQVANQAGWWAAEVGRQPWIVYNPPAHVPGALGGGLGQPDPRVDDHVHRRLSAALRGLHFPAQRKDPSRPRRDRPAAHRQTCAWFLGCQGGCPVNFDSLDLHTVWFVLVGVLFTGYVILDGFDLGVMLTIALIGLPVVLAYSVSIYWIFRGKVQLDKMSY